MEETSDFKKTIEQLEYVGENLYLLFKYEPYNDKFNYTDYKEIILFNILKELYSNKESFVVNSLKQIIMNKCTETYYDKYRSYKHHPNQDLLQNNMKSIETIYNEFTLNFTKEEN